MVPLNSSQINVKYIKTQIILLGLLMQLVNISMVETTSNKIVILHNYYNNLSKSFHQYINNSLVKNVTIYINRFFIILKVLFKDLRRKVQNLKLLINSMIRLRC